MFTRATGVVGEVPPDAASARHEWVLIVDDDAEVLGSMTMLVELAGNGAKPRVRVATSGHEGIRLLEALPFRLIISDYHMDEMDGVEFLLRAQRLVPGIPCILMSGDSGAAEDRLRSSEVENVAFLAKPFDTAFLLGLVGRAMGWPEAAA